MSQLQITDELSGVNHNSITKYLVGLNRSRIRRGQCSADGLFASLVDSNLKFLYIPSRSTLSSSSWSRPDLAHEIVPLNSPRPTPALTHHWFVFFLFHAMEKLSKSYLSKKKLIVILSKLTKSPQHLAMDGNITYYWAHALRTQKTRERIIDQQYQTFNKS